MLHIENLAKRFTRPSGEDLDVLDDLNLQIGEHQIVSLLGASGGGKSTLLRILSGLESASGGRVTLNGRPLHGPQPEIGMVFQEPRLMPWLDVQANVRLALRHLPREVQDERIESSLRAVGLLDFAEALPKALSGGMAQRAALARALARAPDILLLDEPFSALDAFTRARLQDHLLEVWSQARFTAVFVTHDVDEAVYLSDRIVLLRGRPGRIVRDLTVPVPRPRNRGHPELSKMRDGLLEALSEPSGVQQGAPPAKLGLAG